jgi:2'-5' RNA ligase
VRLFLAANFDAVLREQLYAAAAPLREAGPTVSWVARDRLHVTLKFLGEQDASLVPRLSSALENTLAARPAFDVRLRGYGAFPNFRNPRVVWMGGEDARPLVAIAASIDDVCAAIGLARETRPFRAHVTLGRVQRPLDREAARRMEELSKELDRQCLTWRVGAVDLMHSDLRHAGPTYSILESIALGTATQMHT